MTMTARKVNWDEVRKTIPEKPENWNCLQLCTFFRIQELSSICENMQVNAMSGKKMLNLNDNDKLWDDFELSNKDEILVKQYKKQLFDYNQTFDKNQIKPTKEVHIESSQYFEEEVPKASKPIKHQNLIETEKDKHYVFDADNVNAEENVPASNYKPIKLINSPPQKHLKIEKDEKSSKSPNYHDDEDDEELKDETIKKKKKKPTPPIIKLTQIAPHNKLLYHEHSDSFTINRQKDLAENIYLEDSNKEVSRNHAFILYVENLGYCLQDLGSSNHTFIKLDDNTSIILEEGLEIVMGQSIFSIISLSGNSIVMSVLINYNEIDKQKTDKIDLKFNKNFDDICFGSGPKSGKDTFIYKRDPDIFKENAIFKKYKNKFVFIALPSTYGTYLKLGDDKKESDLYLLRNNMEFKLGEFRFRITQTLVKKIPLCACKNISNTITFPCKHLWICNDCFKTEKKCKECAGKIQNILRLRDIYSDL